jgi:hypothetical protein
MAVRVVVYDNVLIREVYRTTVGARTGVAEDIVHEGIDTAAVLTGEYRGGMGVAVSGTRVSAQDTDPDAFFKEFGTVDTEAHAALTNAARRHGRYKGLQPGHH